MKRIWHPWNKWECFKNGFYNSCLDINMTKEEAQKQYYIFLSNSIQFENALKKVIKEWKYSCEHFLTNKSINRIAWLGQASIAQAKGLPAEARGGFNLLSKEQQNKADSLAEKYLNIWKRKHEKKNKKIYTNMEKTRIP